MAATKSTPKDAQVMISILKEMGVADYEPRVLNQMLEFAYRYVTNVLDDAQLFSTHAKKKSIDIHDVRLATKLQVDKYFTCPPSRDLLLDIARQKNSSLLPVIKSSAGLRLPPDRYSLTACNYRLRSTKKIRTVHTVSRLNITSLQQHQGSKVTPAVSLPSKIGANLAVVTKANTPTVSIISRPPNMSSLVRPVPTPIIKFSDGIQSSSSVSTPTTAVPIVTPMSTTTPQMVMPSVGLTNLDPTVKRKRDDEDDYDAE